MVEERQQRILVLGGGYAGVLAALRIQGKLKKQAQVTLVNASPHLLERVRLHEMAAGSPPPTHRLEELVKGTGVELCVGWVEGVELASRQARVRTSDGERALPFDTLVYALGSRAEPAFVPGAREHAHSVADGQAAHRLHAALKALPEDGRVVVMGGGLTAIELASELAERMPHLRVELVTRGLVGSGLSTGARAYLRRVLGDLGVDLREGVAVQRVEADGLWLSGGERVPADVLIWAGGFVANPLARTAGLSVSESGQMRVDPELRSLSHPFVFGAGDGVALDSPAAAHIRMGCVTAMPLAAHAADNVVRSMRGEPLRPFGFSFLIQCISLGRARGLVQIVRGDDSPRELFLSGRAGAWLKERVVRFTVDSLRWERRSPGLYWWPGRGNALIEKSVPRLAA